MENKIIIDANNAVLGRLSSYAAKQALQGNEVIIVNSEKAIIVGREKDILKKYQEMRARGGSGLKGPLFPSFPERILKRTIRGMLPYKKGRGSEIFKDIRCYKGIPKEFEGQKMIKSTGKRIGMSLDKLSKSLKGRA